MKRKRRRRLCRRRKRRKRKRNRWRRRRRSDHDLLMMTFHPRLKRISKPKQTRLKFDFEKLKDVLHLPSYKK